MCLSAPTARRQQNDQPQAWLRPQRRTSPVPSSAPAHLPPPGHPTAAASGGPLPAASATVAVALTPAWPRWRRGRGRRRRSGHLRPPPHWPRRRPRRDGSRAPVAHIDMMCTRDECQEEWRVFTAHDALETRRIQSCPSRRRRTSRRCRASTATQPAVRPRSDIRRPAKDGRGRRYRQYSQGA